jgi:acyl-CoA thioesterase FadM
MYPFIRMFHQLWRFRNKPLALDEPHVSTIRCWPWDLDPWMELNNGRTLTFYDLGRLPLFQRNGIMRIVKQNGWGFTVAGSSVRYRKRITAFEKITMRSRAIGWDDRFFYVVQSLWKADGSCANQVLIRAAMIEDGKMAPPEKLVAMLGWQGPDPVLPDWVQAWIAAEDTRPWPPQI